MKISKSVIMVGAGIGGLCAAARLAHAGYDVTVLEKESIVGGRAHRIEQDGYYFDTGPTILMMTDVLYDTFAACDRQLDDYLDLHQLEPNYKVWFSDQATIEVSSNLPRFSRELARFDSKAPEQFYRYFADVAKIYRLARNRFIDKNFDHVTDFISPRAGWELVRGGGLRRLYPFVSSYFQDERLRQLFSFQSMYLGVTPFEAPAIYSVVSYMETGLGIYYPKGGMYALPQALERLCTELGVTIRCDTAVEQILVDSEARRVRGVQLADQELMADIVISNADLPYTYRQLLPAKHRRRYTDQRLSKLKQASSALLFYWGVDHDLPNMLHHNVYLSDHFRENLEDIFHHHRLPDDPSFYTYIPTKTDPSLAPTGRHVMYVLVPVPNLAADVDWRKATRLIKRQVLERLRSAMGLSLSRYIETETVITPEDFQSRFNLSDGSAFGLSHHFFQSGYFRPHNVSREVGGLYFVGASTYPGSGVPMVTLSGKLVCERIINDEHHGRI